MRPTQPLFDLLSAMFKDAWEQQASHTTALIQSAKQKVVGIERQIEQLVDRVVEATVPSAITRYEQRIAQLEKEKLLMEESIYSTPPHGRVEELFEHAMSFLSNPYKLWTLGQLAHKRTVLKLAFLDRLTYNRKTGLQTPLIALPFKVLDNLNGEILKMVDIESESLNTVFKTLADWENQLKPLNEPSSSQKAPTTNPPTPTKGGR